LRFARRDRTIDPELSAWVEDGMAHRGTGMAREVIIAIVWLAFAAGAASLAYQASLWITGRVR
jgi:hypothetical protein